MKFNKNILYEIMNSNKIKIIIGLMFALNFFLPNMYSNNSYFYDSMVYLLSDGTYNLILILFMIISVYNTVSILNEYREMILRFNNKNEYFSTLIKYTLITNLIIIILNYLLLSSSCMILSDGFYVIDTFYNGVNSAIYMIWTIIKQIIILSLFGIVMLYLRILLKKPINLISSIILLLPISFSSYTDKLVTNLSQMFILYSDYSVYHRYSSLSLEISCFSIYHCIYILILIFIYYKILKKASLIN